MKLRVEPIAGEMFLRYHVQSRSHPETPRLVDLSFWGGYGRCDCEHWCCTIWPVLRDMNMEDPKRPDPMTAETSCLHVRCAFSYFARALLPIWIKHTGQGGDFDRDAERVDYDTGRS